MIKKLMKQIFNVKKLGNAIKNIKENSLVAQG